METMVIAEDMYQDRDFRAAARAQQRDRKQKEKYYHYRASNPAMVGKLCYTVTMITPETEFKDDNKYRKRARNRDHAFDQVEDREDIIARKKILKDAGYVASNIAELLVEVASTADKHRQQSGLPSPNDGDILPSCSLDQTLEGFHTFAAEMERWNPVQYWASCDHINARLRLKVRTWTKRDNYENRIEFKNSYYMAQRHHSRKLNYDGKHYNKQNLHNMRRDMKSTSRVLAGHRISSGRWELKYDDVPWECCHLCECILNYDPDSTSDMIGMEEYLWKWDENVLYTWQDEYLWRTGIDVRPSDIDAGQSDQLAEVLANTGCENESEEDDDTHISLGYVIQSEITASSDTSSSGWVLFWMSDTESDSDLMSDSEGLSLDSDWEELIGIPGA